MQLKQALSRLEQLAKTKLSKYTQIEVEKITGWLTTYTGRLNLSVLTQYSARDELLTTISQDPVRTWLLELAIAFYIYGGDTDDFEERLVNSLVQGLRFEGRNLSYCELPEEVLMSGPLTQFPVTLSNSFVLWFLRTLRLTREITLKEYLLSNRHIQIVAMLALVDDLVISELTS